MQRRCLDLLLSASIYVSPHISLLVHLHSAQEGTERRGPQRKNFMRKQRAENRAKEPKRRAKEDGGGKEKLPSLRKLAFCKTRHTLQKRSWPAQDYTLSIKWVQSILPPCPYSTLISLGKFRKVPKLATLIGKRRSIHITSELHLIPRIFQETALGFTSKSVKYTI